MPQVEVVLFRDSTGDVPLLNWLDHLSLKVRDKCLAALERLEEMGNELRRPSADYLQDGIYELRVHFRTANYRMLYFFAGRRIVVVSHGFVKEQRVPLKEISLAGKRREAFLSDPKTHTFIPE
jgi:phage-related protein